MLGPAAAAAMQAFLPRSLRMLSLSLNMGTLVILGGAAGNAAASRLARQRNHTQAGTVAEPLAADATSSPRSQSKSGNASRAQAYARSRRPSRWLQGQALFSGSSFRGFASLPCPLSDDEDEEFEFDQEDLTDLHWQSLWQQQQEAYLAARQQAVLAARAAAAAVSASQCGLTPAAAAAAAWPSGHPQQEQHHPASAAAAAEAAGACIPLHPQQQQLQREALAVAASLREVYSAQPPGVQGSLPWERYGPDEMRRQLAAARAEWQPRSKRSMHSMVLPFISEAYSMAAPVLGGEGDAGQAAMQQVASKAGRPCMDPEELQLQQQQRQQAAQLAARAAPREWPGGAPSVSIGRVMRRLFSAEARPALAEALARLDACYTPAGGWDLSCGPELLQRDSEWKPPGPGRSPKMATFLMQEAGATEEDVVSAIRDDPWLLGLDLEAHARPALDLLSRFGISGLSKRQGRGRKGSSASGSSSGGKGEGMTGQGRRQQSTPVGRLMASRPVLMLMLPELEGLLEYMLGLGFSPTHQEKLLRETAELCGLEGEQRLRLAVSFLAGKGLSREEVVHVINKVPRVLQYSPEELQLKWQYMEEALGGSSKDIAACPHYLEASLESVLGPRVALAHSLGVPILLPSVEGEGQQPSKGRHRGQEQGPSGVEEQQGGGISLWKLLRDNTSKLAAKLGTTAEEVQRHVRHWQQHEAARWQQLQPRDLEHYTQFTSVQVHLATHQRCCSY